MTQDDLPLDAVERVREIRRRHYEEIKHMTREEMREHNCNRMRKSEAEFKSLRDQVKPDDFDFPFLSKRKQSVTVPNSPTPVF